MSEGQAGHLIQGGSNTNSAKKEKLLPHQMSVVIFDFWKNFKKKIVNWPTEAKQ